MYYNHDLIRSKLECIFVNENKYNNFAGITKDYIEEVRKDMEERKDFFRTKGEWITTLIMSIIDNRPAVKIDSFDKRIIHLIEGLDPYCYTYKRFVTMDRPGNKAKMKQLQSLPEEERAKEIKAEKLRLAEFKDDVEEKIGHFEQKLIKYESVYLKLLKKLGLTNDNNIRELVNLLTINPISLDFSSISEERHEELKENTRELSLITPKSISQVINSINYNSELLEERIIELIYTIDSDLDILRAYKEGNKWPEIYEKIKTIKKITTYSKVDKELITLLVKLETMINAQYNIIKEDNWTI